MSGVGEHAGGDAAKVARIVHREQGAEVHGVNIAAETGGCQRGSEGVERSYGSASRLLTVVLLEFSTKRRNIIYSCMLNFVAAPK